MADVYEKEIYQSGSGHGYRVKRNGVVENDQPTKPGVPGTVYMTEAEANATADEIIALKVNPPVPNTVVEFGKALSDTEKAVLDTFLKQKKLAYTVR